MGVLIASWTVPARLVGSFQERCADGDHGRRGAPERDRRGQSQGLCQRPGRPGRSGPWSGSRAFFQPSGRNRQSGVCGRSAGPRYVPAHRPGGVVSPHEVQQSVRAPCAHHRVAVPALGHPAAGLGEIVDQVGVSPVPPRRRSRRADPPARPGPPAGRPRARQDHPRHPVLPGRQGTLPGLPPRPGGRLAHRHRRHRRRLPPPGQRPHGSTSPAPAGAWKEPRPSCGYARSAPAATRTPTGTTTSPGNTTATTSAATKTTSNSPHDPHSRKAAPMEHRCRPGDDDGASMRLRQASGG